MGGGGARGGFITSLNIYIFPIEGGIGSEHAHGGSVRVGRRDTLDEKLGLRLLRAVEIEGKASVFIEYVLDVREHL